MLKNLCVGSLRLQIFRVAFSYSKQGRPVFSGRILSVPESGKAVSGWAVWPKFLSFQAAFFWKKGCIQYIFRFFKRKNTLPIG